VINAQDENFNNLEIWVDTGNTDGIATGVIESLSQLGITQLNLNAQATTENNNGNIIGLISTFETSTGISGQMADVWFAAQNTNAATSSVVTKANLASRTTLSENVSGLVNAISNFNQNVINPISTNVEFITQPSTTEVATGVVGANMISTINALSQFNANGQALSGSISNSTQGQISLSNTIVTGPDSATLVIPSAKKSS